MLKLKTSMTYLVGILCISAFFITKIQITNTPSTYIPKHLKSKILNDELMEEFNNEDTLIFLFQSEKALDNELVSRMSKFTTKVEQFDLVNKVRSIFNYESIQAIKDGFEITNIIDKQKLDSLKQKDIFNKVDKDRFVKDFFITKDLKTFGVLIEPNYIYSSLTRMDLEKKVLAALDEYKLKKFMIAYGGEFAVDTAQYKELDRMMFFIVPITFVVGVLLLYFLFNSYTAVIVGSVFNGVITFVVLSLFGAFNWPYNMLASMIPSLMMALSIAFIVHLFNGILLRKEMGESHEESVKNAVNSIKKPSMFSALTTCAGLFSLAISDIPPVRSVGVVGGIGVLLIYLMVIYILPPMLIKFNLGEWKQHRVFKNVLDKIVDFLVHTAMENHKKVILILLGSMAVLSLFIFQVKSESNLYKFFEDDHEVNKASRSIKKHFVGTTIINLAFDSDKSSIISAEFHSKMDQLKTSMKGIPGVGRVFSATDIIKQLNWAFQGENEKFFAVPVSDELIEQYLFIYDGEDLYDFLSRGQDRTKVTLNLNVQGANEIEAISDQIEAHIKKIGFSNFKWAISGYGKMFSDQENLIIQDLIKSVSISLVVIFILMAFLWGSIKSSFFCMIPNVSPVVAMFIIMGAFGIWLDMGTAMIASITVGIAVDDTIHIFEGLMRRKHYASIREGLIETYQESGKAVIITSLILSAQFSILIFSNFIPLRNFGLLTTVGIITALIFDLLLLPALVVLTSSRK
jgi:predicted RND superfamily exporter protein